ncbi:MAG: FlgD immunoglobulin-like domain containing protein [Candidatus Eisenbacteria bacterium]|nr:FlgD immunoglobulin-like domain containing protein [Candidatus Eisenbacteria bacterium]
MVEALEPNPSHGNARLAFSLGQASRVEVGVYDVGGRRIRLVESAQLAAGSHEAAWDGRDEDGARVRAGVYFVSLQVDGRAAGTRRLIVLR